MNSFKSLVKTIADKAGGEFGSPSRGGRDEDSAPGPADGAEGFICPTCMRGFATPDELQGHYESQHGSEASIAVAKRTAGNFADLKDEVGELQNTLREELFYSAELKREIERLSDAVCNKNKGEGGEHDGVDINKLVRELEEGKQILTREVISLRQQLSEAQMTALEKQRLMEKAAQLAAENVRLKATVDEMSSQKEAVEQKLSSAIEDLKERGSVDDATVLRQELVAVQKMMDEVTRQKEAELKVMKDKFETAANEIEVMRHSSAADQEGAQEKLRYLRDENKELERLQEELKDRLKDAETKMADLKNMTQKDGLENEQLLTDLKTKLTAAEEQNRQLQGAENKIRLESEQLQQRLAGQDSKASDLNDELSTLQRHYDDQCRQNDSLKSQLLDEKNNLEEARRHVSGRDAEINKQKDALKHCQDELERLNQEKGDLLVKIEAGEGANTALTQLKQQNESLQSQLRAFDERFKSKTQEKDGEIEKLHVALSESKTTLAKSSERTEKLEQVKEDLAAKAEALSKTVARLEGELDAKTTMWNSSESTLVSEKQSLSSALDAVKTTLQDKAVELERATGKLSEAQKNLAKEAERREQVAKEKEDIGAALNEKAQALSQLQQKFKDQDDATNRLKADHQVVCAEKNKLKLDLENQETELNDLKSANSDKDTQIRNLNEDRAKLSDSLTSCEAKIKDMKKTLDEKDHKISEVDKLFKACEDKINGLQSELISRGEKENELVEALHKQTEVTDALKKEAKNKVEGKEKEIAELRKMMDEMSQNLQKLERSTEALKEEKEREEEKVCNLQRLREKERSELDEKLRDLEQARELLLNDKVTLQTQLEEDQSRRAKAEEEDKRWRAQSEAKQKELKAELDCFKEKMDIQSREYAAEADRHESEISILRDQVSSERNRFDASEARVASLETKLAQASRELESGLSERLEMEAKLGSAQDERRSLLERCLTAESELDRSRTTLNEHRRKADDYQAALHEMARENQSIQVELAKQTGRKWADDSEVSECTTCRSTFSLTQRKHHCRNCLQIYCNECSSKTAAMQNYKKPQRVCDQCYTELQQAK